MVEIEKTIHGAECVIGLGRMAMNSAERQSRIPIKVTGLPTADSSIDDTFLCDLNPLVDQLSAAEKAAVMKFIKMQYADVVNQATGLSLTWEDIPNAIFQPQE